MKAADYKRRDEFSQYKCKAISLAESYDLLQDRRTVLQYRNFVVVSRRGFHVICRRVRKQIRRGRRACWQICLVTPKLAMQLSQVCFMKQAQRSIF